MAIYHLSMKAVSRAKGRSATAAAAYRAGEAINDNRTGLTHDYSRKRGVEHAEALLPGGDRVDRASLWNAVEAKHRRKDAVVAREIEVALPRELDAQQRQALAVQYAQDLANRYGVAADVAIHAPLRRDSTNHHAHILLTACQVSAEGHLGPKAVALDPIAAKRAGAANLAEVERERWASLCNQALTEAGHDARIDHRSLADQHAAAVAAGDLARATQLDRQPQIHVGPAGTAMAERGQQPESQRRQDGARIIDYPAIDQGRSRAQRRAEIEASNAVKAAERAQEAARLAGEREREQWADIMAELRPEQQEGEDMAVAARRKAQEGRKGGGKGKSPADASAAAREREAAAQRQREAAEAERVKLAEIMAQLRQEQPRPTRRERIADLTAKVEAAKQATAQAEARAKAASVAEAKAREALPRRGPRDTEAQVIRRLARERLLRPYETKADEASALANEAANRADKLTAQEPKALDWIRHPVRSWRQAGEAHQAREEAAQAEAKADLAFNESQRRWKMLQHPDAGTKRALARAEREVMAEVDKLTADAEDRSQERGAAEHEAEQERRRTQQLEDQLARELREDWTRQAEEMLEQQRQAGIEMGLEIGGDLEADEDEDDGPNMEF